MCFDNFFRQRQSQTSTAMTTCGGSVYLHKTIEYTLELIGWDTSASIFDFGLDFAIAAIGDVHINFISAISKFDRVGDQLIEDFMDTRPIRDHV